MSGGGSATEGAGGSGAPDTMTLTGSVVEIDDELLENEARFVGVAEVFVQAPSGFVSQSLDGSSDDIALPGVARRRQNWVTVDPAELTYLTTLQPLDTTSDEPVRVRIVRTAPVDRALQGLVTPLVRTANTAQIAVFLEDSSGIGRPGLYAEVASAEAVVFSDGAMLSDQMGTTDGSGLVFAVNVLAAPTPTDVVVAVSNGLVTGSVVVRTQSATLTLVHVDVSELGL